MSFFKIVFLIVFNFLLTPLYLCIYVLCFILTFFPIFPTRTSKVNLKNHLHIQGIKANFYISFIFINYFFYILEAFVLDPLHLTHCSMQQKHTFIEILKKLKTIYPQSKDIGFVYILAHLANVELYTTSLVHAHKRHQEKKLYALAKPTKYKFINKLLLWYRQRRGIGVFWTDHNLLSNMWQAIKNGSSVAMVVDQKPKTGGTFINFFGDYAAFPISGLRFCMSKNMIVVYASGQRILPGWLGLKVQCGKNIHLERQMNSDSEETRTNHLQQSCLWKPELIKPKDKPAALEMSFFSHWIENEIRKSPTQWCWDYKKWSRKPI
jgi:lauroyl/myristoyl acyltransferase